MEKARGGNDVYAQLQAEGVEAPGEPPAQPPSEAEVPGSCVCATAAGLHSGPLSALIPSRFPAVWMVLPQCRVDLLDLNSLTHSHCLGKPLSDPSREMLYLLSVGSSIQEH